MIGYKEEPLEQMLPKKGEYWLIRGSNAIKQVKAASSGEVKFTDGTIRNIAALVERVPPEGLPQKSMVEKFCQYADEVGLEKAVWGIYDLGRINAFHNTNPYPKEPSPSSMGMGIITPPQETECPKCHDRGGWWKQKENSFTFGEAEWFQCDCPEGKSSPDERDARI